MAPGDIVFWFNAMRNVAEVERRHHITRTNRLVHLVATRSKPWHDCSSNPKRLGSHNGLLLTPVVDHLFGGRPVPFENGGRLPVATVIRRKSIQRMGIAEEATNVDRFSVEQVKCLEFHLEQVFPESEPGLS